jgi:hypothetical protein
MPRSVSQFLLTINVVAASLLVASTSAAQDQVIQSGIRPLARTPRAGTPRLIEKGPKIDGRLDEAEWKDGETFTDFVQREQKEGEPSSERTDVRILTDGEALYIGAWMHDREASGIVSGEKIRDVAIANSDYIAIIFDTYRDRQNGFVFATTPSGVEYDGQVIREGEGGGVFQTGQTQAQAGSMGGFNLNWDGSWRVATSVDSLGWYAEFRIPFSTLRYGGGTPQTWGMNIARMIRRKNEESFWSFVPRQFNMYRMSVAGTLDSLQVPVRRAATITPYVLSSAQRDFVGGVKTEYPREWGADLKYGLTPSLTLDLTYNTDFAQVEVDEQRTNLTRFPLFFPEKRPFFLENAGVFSAGTPQAADLFFSRRVGIDNLGNPVPIIGGGRVTGRVGSTTIGLLQIFTDDAEGGTVPGQSYSVFRALREVSRRSRIGVIGIQRAQTGKTSDNNRTFGVDGRLGFGDKWTMDVWGAKTSTPGRTGDDLGYSARAAYVTRDWSNSARYMALGADFNPEVGFLNRAGGYRYYEVNAMRVFRKKEWTWLRQWNPHTSYRGYVGRDGFYQSGQTHLDATEVEFANGGKFGPEYNIYHEGLQQPFAIAPGVIIPVGSYNWGQLGLDWTMNPSAPLSMVLRGDFGPFYNGTRNGGSVTVTARKGAALSSSLLVDYQDVKLDQGDFTRTLIGVRAAYFFTPRIFLQSLTQYNNQQRIWTANARLGWLSTAGTGLFIVFNEGQEADGFFAWQRPMQRSIIVKYTRQIGTGS